VTLVHARNGRGNDPHSTMWRQAMTPSIFLRITDGKLILWDYRRHAQYEIGLPYVARLVELSAVEGSDAVVEERDAATAGIDAEIRASKVLDDPEPQAWEWDCLARIFHVGSQIMEAPCPADTADAYRGYVDYCASIADRIPEMHIELPGEAIALPPPALDALARMSLWDALVARRTCREFHGERLGLSEVATALWATFGAVHGTERADLLECGLMPVGYRRTSPSGGSLHPSEPYLVALRVDGLEPGIYHYRSGTHALTHVAPAPQPGGLAAMLCAQTFAEGLSYGIFVVSRFDKMWWKYPHSRAYRVALFDIGCLIQTFQLSCAAQGIQSWPTGYLVDHEINRWLELDDAKHSVMFFLGAGIGSGSVAPEALAAIHGSTRGD
jgi:SagB-type dehydrogenase family enzyme